LAKIPSSLEDAEKLFWEGAYFVISPTPSPIYTEKLLKAARIWRKHRDFLSAGLATSSAVISSFKLGVLFFPQVSSWTMQALDDYAHSIEENRNDELATILAFMKSYQELIRFTTKAFSDSLSISRRRYSVMMNLSKKLLSTLSDHSQGSELLLEGFRVEGPMGGPWTMTTVDKVYTYNFFDAENRILSYRVDPAFELLIATGDYAGANAICQQFPDAFNKPRLKGWCAAVQALINPQKAHKLFFQAAYWLEKDEPDAERLMRSFGEFANKGTWSVHFKMRGHLALASVEEDRFEHHLSQAANLSSKSKVIRIPEVERFDLLVRTLAHLLDDAKGISPSEAREYLLNKTRFDHEIYDEIILQFIDNAAIGLAELRTNRKHGLVKIGTAFAALNRLPLLGTSDSNAFSTALDRKALSVIEGPLNSWIHKSISEIDSEDVLRKVLFRLFQNQIPHYAQIRHGPIEYGKDIVVCISEPNESAVLRMYQVKCGDVTKDNWNKTCKPQLEEIFQVPMCKIQITETINKRIGILIWNGHLSPYVEAIINAWKKEQLEIFGRRFEFMNLDDIVNYIMDNRLVNALRAALSEYSSSNQ
jgi:hypothetical protein